MMFLKKILITTFAFTIIGSTAAYTNALTQKTNQSVYSSIFPSYSTESIDRLILESADFNTIEYTETSTSLQNINQSITSIALPGYSTEVIDRLMLESSINDKTKFSNESIILPPHIERELTEVLPELFSNGSLTIEVGERIVLHEFEDGSQLYHELTLVSSKPVFIEPHERLKYN